MKQIKIVTVQETPTNKDAVDSPEVCQKVWNEEIATSSIFDNQKEHLVVIILNTKLKPIGWNLVSIGTLNETVAHPREILRPVIVASAYAFILMHNHPSGDSSPSHADKCMTKNLQEAAKIMQVNFFDHVIIAGNEKFSFREAGLL